MAKKNYNPDQLDDFIQTMSEIICTSCNKGASIEGDYVEASREFFDLGWRATPNNVYCPKCVKKKLKK